MTKHKELLLGGKKVGKTSFLSRHCEDGVYEWGFQDGKMMADGLKRYMNKPKPLVSGVYRKKLLIPRKRLATA